MTVVFTRMDERLVHGQIVTAWKERTGYRAIGVADDTAAADEFERGLIADSDPETPMDFRPVAEGPIWYGETVAAPRLVLVRSPQALRGLVRAGAPLREVNLGNRHPRLGARRFTEHLYLTREDIEALEEVAGAGVRLIAQVLPSSKAMDVNRELAEGRLAFDHLPSGHP